MFKTRNVVTVLVVLGVAAGVWLSDLWKGLGGSGLGVGGGDTPLALSTEDGSDTPAETVVDVPVSLTHSGQTVRVVIRDRDYFLKEGSDETPVSLDRLVEMVSSIPGDEDGIRLRVYRAESARVTADLELKEALQRADIPDSATYWSPDAAR